MSSRILLICGTINQTQMMIEIGNQLEPENECWYAPFYSEGITDTMARVGLLGFTAMGGSRLRKTHRYLDRAGVRVDLRGRKHDYDLVITCTDLIIQENIRDKPIVLVQEGLMEPENVRLELVRSVGLPRYVANTAATGLSDEYDVFCVASIGYRDWFIDRGVRPEKIAVTGVPNFNHAVAYRDNDFPYRDFVLIATSNARETFKWDNRRAFLREALEIAAGRQVVFKLHPAENHRRAIREVRQVAPEAPIYTAGRVEEMIANCEVLIAQYSSVVFVAHALRKGIHSYVDPADLARLTLIQNGGTSARRIAEVAETLLAGKALKALPASVEHRPSPSRLLRLLERLYLRPRLVSTNSG